MTRPSPSLLAAGLALAAAFALAACDDRRDDAQVDDAANPPPAATTPGPTDMPDADGDGMPDADDDGSIVDADAAVTVTSVELGNEVGADNRVPAPMGTFATSDTVHASVVTDGTGGTVSTRWTFEDGQVVHTEDKIVPAGNQVTDFMITNPAGWPTGTYTLAVSVDGQEVDTRTFEVR